MVPHGMHPPQTILAIVYDFDHTLSPHYMQDHTILRRAGIDPNEFWPTCTALIKEKGYDQELAYMKRMLEHEQYQKFVQSRFKGHGTRLDLFPWSPRVF